MPKKTQRNAFYFYMQEQVIPKMRREGRFTGMEEVVKVAHPSWKALPPKDKARYESMAKEYKGRMRGQDGDNYRLDNIGNVIGNRKNPLEEMKKRKQKEKLEFIQRWPEGEEVINEKFYFIDFLTLCKTEEGDYLPAELGMAEFTLKDGIKKTMHTFIDPGPIPLGYRYECQRESDATHKIPVEGFELAERNYRSIWLKLENFVNPGGNSSVYPYIFCAEEKMEVIEYCMEWVHRHACLGIPNRLRKIAHLETMVQELFKQIGKSPPSEVAIHNLLTTSAFDYETGVMCSWHEEVESKFCAMGRVRIHCYALADAMCSLYDLPLTKTHLPLRSTEPVCSVIRPMKEPEPSNTQYRGKGRGKGRGQDVPDDIYPARDFRVTDSSWKQAPVPQKSAWGNKKEDGGSWSRKGAKAESVKGPEPAEDDENFEPPEPQLSQSLRKPKNPGIAQMGRGITNRMQPQQQEQPASAKPLGAYGTLIPKSGDSEIDIGHKVERMYEHPMVAPGAVVYANGQAPPKMSQQEEWPSLGGPAPAEEFPSLGAPSRGNSQQGVKPKFAGRAGPPPAQQAPQLPPGWSNGRGMSNMQDIANSLTGPQAKSAWGAPPTNLMLAGAGRGRGAWTATGRLPPGMAQPTVLPKNSNN